MIQVDVEQGSAEWLALRRGCITGTKAASLKTDKTRATLAKNLLVERLAVETIGQPQTPEMLRGIELEASAVARYELFVSEPVSLLGFAWHDAYEGFCGVSVDRLVGDSGLLEIKCPSSTVHMDYMLSDGPPKDYWFQMQMQMWVTGREWCDWMTFDDRLRTSVQCRIVRVLPSEKAYALFDEHVPKLMEHVYFLESLLLKRETEIETLPPEIDYA